MGLAHIHMVLRPIGVGGTVGSIKIDGQEISQYVTDVEVYASVRELTRCKLTIVGDVEIDVLGANITAEQEAS